MISEQILARARDWLAHDPDPETRAELAPLIEARADELAERFSGPLSFGTAGLRGILGAGESRMNRAVVRRATAALGAHLLASDPQAARLGVVVGYDGRTLSRELAQDTAGVLCAAGLRVFLSDKPCPTPVVAFAVKDLGAAAGVMVTASHNPPEYNGYKVYAQNGAQIIPPADQAIARAIEEGPAADAIALTNLPEARHRGLLSRFGEALWARYLDAVAGLCDQRGPGRDLPIVYTPMHGVGGELFALAMARAGFANLRVVPEQAEPDGAFPTVRFPNPEEPGALDLAIALAEKTHARLILANDPDADRLAAVVRDANGRYVALGGNDLGVLLAAWAIDRALDEGARARDAGQPLVITTVVSSPLLGQIARARGVAYDETLTGFKWIAHKAMQRRARGERFVFGYEEALGYSVGELVRDKDGISAAVVLATLAADLFARGQTLLDELERIGTRYGSFVSRQKSLQFPGASGAAAMAATMARLRAEPPRAIAGRQVTAVADCLRGTKSEAGSETPLDLPKSDVLVLSVEGGHRVVVRPSGTEPKLKIYFDVAVRPAASSDERSAAAALLDRIELETLALAGAGARSSERAGAE